MNIIIRKQISKNLLTTKDLNDFFAYCEKGEWEKAHHSSIHYVFTKGEQKRLEKLLKKVNYVSGQYDEENVKRIEGIWYEH